MMPYVLLRSDLSESVSEMECYMTVVGEEYGQASAYNRKKVTLSG